MHKSIRLNVKLQIEADADPAADFAADATQAVKDMLAAGRWRHPTLKVSVNSITEESGGADESESTGK
jgi:hypothetical protein